MEADMPRRARIDLPGALHHIICRGIERRFIFLGDDDLDDFVKRLSRIVRDSGTLCYAWALMPNHCHLLLRTGSIPISTVMRRLLTGYAVSFNKRHDRQGRLFQNRYKSILCQQEPYFLELVRYIHLNPLRAGNVDDLNALDSYAFCGHSRVMGSIVSDWQAVDGVLALFGKEKYSARCGYRQFIQEGIGLGRREALTGGGVVRSAGGWEALKSSRQMNSHLKGDERILGDSDFVRQVLDVAQEGMRRRYALVSGGCTFETIVECVAAHFDLPAETVLLPGKQRQRAMARSLVAYLAVKELGMDGTGVGQRMGVSQSAVSRAVMRGEQVAGEHSISLIDDGNA
jgi:putative transposase